MNIAFVSYEYPPDTGFGGIATYVYQIANAFSEKQVHVHVVSATFSETRTVQENEYLTIHRLFCRSHEEFSLLAAQKLQQLHSAAPLNLVEAPDFGGDALYIKNYLQDVPLIIKLHTPNYLVKKLNNYYYDKQWFRRLKHYFKPYQYQKDKEYQAVQQADFIISPSKSLKDIVAADWKIDKSKIIHAPYIYRPSQQLLEIPKGSGEKTVLYFGRLETRKGVYNLSKALPKVLQQVPDAQFVFVGADCRGPRLERSMKKILAQQLNGAADRVTFINAVPLNEVPFYLSKTAVCVFPSLWENFPNVCLEAMSAARGIVASRNGGMQDMLEDINGGVLIDPHNVEELAAAIIRLLQDDEMAAQMGARSRKKIKEVYAEEMREELLTLYHRLAGLPH